jgi:DivIVA domain-containing protein
MAMSFSRPDPSSPASVADASFSTGRRGFDQGEVRDFMRMVAAELGRLQERERFLERELRTAQSNPDLSSVELDDQALTRLLGEETARVLTTARESANEIRQKAEQAAAQMLSEASDEATRVREEAEIEASRRRSDAGADAEAELSMAKQQGREMVNEARAYRERVLSELARRRELAREQIEQLLHGRDRLIQSFERARLAAVDVISELQPLGEPDEYVNLAPTTGPVPVMVPNQPRPGDDTGADDTWPMSDAAAIDAVEGDDVVAGTAEVSSVDGATVVAIDDDDADADAGDDLVADVVEPVVVDTFDATPTGAGDDPVRGDTDTGDGPDDGASAETDVGDDARDDERDDVVVDLFARLRADTTATDGDLAEADEHVGDVTTDASADAGTTHVPDADTTDASDVEPAAVDRAGDDQADGGGGEVHTEPTAFEQRDAILTPLIVSSAKRLKRTLADEQNEVLDALRRNEPVRSLDALLPSAKDHRYRYTSAIVDDVLMAANAGASAAGRPSALRKVDATRAVAAADDVLGEWITLPLRERLERCIADGDGDNAGISRRVRAVYREWKTQHIDDQLDDVFRTAHGRGAYAAVDKGTPVLWVCDPAHDGCADCNDNTLAGALPAGERFPTGHEYAPAHLGCRCLLLTADR